MIRPCGYLENIWPLSVSLANRERRAELTKADGRLVIRDGRYERSDIKKDGKWASMRSAIQKANRVVIEQIPQWEIATVFLEELAPGDALPWLKSGPEITVHVAIVTNPLCHLFAGAMRGHIPVGDIVAIDPLLWSSAINDGPTARVHLVMMLTKRDAAEREG